MCGDEQIDRDEQIKQNERGERMCGDERIDRDEQRHCATLCLTIKPHSLLYFHLCAEGECFVCDTTKAGNC